MKFHLISLSPSCFGNNKNLELTIRILNYLFRQTILINYQNLYGKIVNESRTYLDHNRLKDFELILLMYDKEKRIVEVSEIGDHNFTSLCKLNRFLFERGITILYSKEDLHSSLTTSCKDFCFMVNESDQDDIKTYTEKYPVPPSQEIRLEKSHDSDWMATNIYIPLLTCSSKVEIIDPFIGRELHDISDVHIDKWLTESQWIFSLTEIFKIFKVQSIYREKHYSIHTAVRIDEEDKAVEAAKRFRKFFLNAPDVEVKFILYVYEKLFNPPEEFPHDRYIFSNNVGVNIGIGIDTINPEDEQVRRETQLTAIGISTVTSVMSQLKSLPDSTTHTKKRRILRKRTI
ncbi:MAG: hypothetical protein ACFFB5_05585 [Promethearchaeota archaeon]